MPWQCVYEVPLEPPDKQEEVLVLKQGQGLSFICLWADLGKASMRQRRDLSLPS